MPGMTKTEDSGTYVVHARYGRAEAEPEAVAANLVPVEQYLDLWDLFPEFAEEAERAGEDPA